jgi:signal transduction histidine kinase
VSSSAHSRESVTETALRAALLLGVLGYAVVLVLLRPSIAPVSTLGRAGLDDAVLDLLLAAMLAGSGIVLAAVGRSPAAGIAAVGVGGVWLTIVSAGSMTPSDPHRGPALAAAMLLAPAVLGLGIVLAGTAPDRRRVIVAWAATIGLAVLVAASRVAAYDPFADPSCVNCGHATPLLPLSMDQRAWLDRAATALAIAAAAGVIWLGVLRVLPQPRRLAASKAISVVGCLVVGVAVLVAVAVGTPVGVADVPRIVDAAARIGVGLVVVGLTWLAADLVRIRVAMRRLALDLTSAMELGRLDARLARALADPSLVVGYWVPSDGRYVAADGTTLGSAWVDAPRDVVSIKRDGRPIAAIRHHRDIGSTAIRDELTRSLLVALDNERLQAVSLANLHALNASRARIVEIQEEQRRQVERDLHDGLQQRLLAIAIDVRSARVVADRAGDVDGARLLADTEARALALVDAVRRMAHGIHPAILTGAGLGAALTSLAEESPIPVQVSIADPERLPANTETSVYQIVVAALSDAVRRGATDLSVVVERAGVDVAVRIDLDVDTASVPTRIADLIAAAGGGVTIAAPAGLAGTSLRIRLPCA